MCERCNALVGRGARRRSSSNQFTITCSSGAGSRAQRPAVLTSISSPLVYVGGCGAQRSLRRAIVFQSDRASVAAGDSLAPAVALTASAVAEACRPAARQTAGESDEQRPYIRCPRNVSHPDAGRQRPDGSGVRGARRSVGSNRASPRSPSRDCVRRPAAN